MHLQHSFSTMASAMSNVEVDDDLIFLEVQDMQGMTTDEYATHEIREMHKSLKEGFAFKHSPILNDLDQIKEIPSDKILSSDELKEHIENEFPSIMKELNKELRDDINVVAKVGDANTLKGDYEPKRVLHK
eukprot:g314.t1